MEIQIGTDEAGYGPNLGPLTISGTAWQVRDSGACLYELLADAVTAQTSDQRLCVADSKAIYQSGATIAGLETSVLAILYAIDGQVPGNWLELLAAICPEDVLARVDLEAWTSARQLELPLAADLARIEALGQRFRGALESSGVRLLKVHCQPIFPADFNSSVERLGNKATLLSHSTLELIDDLIRNLEFSRARVVCDKHGGRSKYAGLIQHVLTEQLVSIEQESPGVSRYRWREKRREITINFVAGGESFLPTAMASMFAKYAREIFMQLWNDFWVQHIPDLRPTKGYPVDARRFMSEIELVQQKLGIRDTSIWRNR